MKIAEIVEENGEQFIILPPEYQLEGEKVYIEKVGNSVILHPYKKPWEDFDDGSDMFSDDIELEKN